MGGTLSAIFGGENQETTGIDQTSTSNPPPVSANTQEESSPEKNIPEKEEAKPTPVPVPPAQPKPPEKPDRSIFVQKNKSGEVINRVPGQINGNQFVGNTLNQCKVIVRDFCDSVTIDKATDSDFILCCVRGSIFARDCTNCRFVMVCGQFRCRNCVNCHFFMHVKTGPVIESSENLTIGCAQISYPELSAQMEKAKLFPSVNIWNDIHDFTPGEGHFSLADGVKLTAKEMEILEPYEENEQNYLLPFMRCSSNSSEQWCVKISEEKMSEIAKLSQNIKIIKSNRDQSGIAILTIEGESKEQIEAMFSPLNPIEITQETI